MSKTPVIRALLIARHAAHARGWNDEALVMLVNAKDWRDLLRWDDERCAEIVEVMQKSGSTLTRPLIDETSRRAGRTQLFGCVIVMSPGMKSNHIECHYKADGFITSMKVIDRG